MKKGSVIRITPDTKELNVTIEPKQLYTEYKVRKKETLYSISKKFGTTVEEIKEMQSEHKTNKARRYNKYSRRNRVQYSYCGKSYHECRNQ